MTREQIVSEARSWLGTPYHLKARVKGAGADCFTFPAEVYIACGLFEREKLPHFQSDWFLNTSDERYLMLLRRATEIITSVCWPTLKIEPGNLAVARVAGSRVYNHSAIVLNYPRCIHCIGDGVQEFDIHRDPMWAFHEVKFFDPFRTQIGYEDSQTIGGILT